MRQVHRDLVALLERVDAGDLRPVPLPQGQFCDIHYEIDGWKIAVFDDCGDFDYIDHAISPDGDRIEFDEMYADWKAWCDDDTDNSPDKFASSYPWHGANPDRDWRWREMTPYR